MRLIKFHEAYLAAIEKRNKLLHAPHPHRRVMDVAAIGLMIAANIMFAPFIYTQLFGTVAAGWFFYHQVPQLYTVLGAGLIALGGCIVLLHRPRREPGAAPAP